MSAKSSLRMVVRQPAAVHLENVDYHDYHIDAPNKLKKQLNTRLPCLQIPASRHISELIFLLCVFLIIHKFNHYISE